MEMLFELNMISMPNFLTIKMPPGRREEGLRPPPSIQIGQLDKVQAEIYAEEMRKEFIKHWEKQSILYKTDNYVNKD